eukprot:858541_1
MSLLRIIILTLLCGVQKIESVCIGGAACVIVPPLTRDECLATTEKFSATAPIRCTWQVGPAVAAPPVPLGLPPSKWVSGGHDDAYKSAFAFFVDDRMFYTTLFNDNSYRHQVQVEIRNFFDHCKEQTDATIFEIGLKNMQYLHSQFVRKYTLLKKDKHAWRAGCNEGEPPPVVAHPDDKGVFANKNIIKIREQWYRDNCPKLLMAFSIVRDLASKARRLRVLLTKLRSGASANIEYSNYYANDRLKQSIQRSGQIAISEFALLVMLFIGLFALLVIG